MQIPIPPSENLYKFMCLSALLGLLAIWLWSEKQIADLENRYSEQERALLVTEVELRALERDAADIKGSGRDAADLKVRLQALRIKEAEREAGRRSLTRLQDRLFREATHRMWFVYVLAPIGLIGLVLWLKYVQNYQDRLLRAQVEAAEAALRPSGPAEPGPEETIPPKQRRGSGPPSATS